MTKPKADRGKKTDKIPNDDEQSSEQGEHGAVAIELRNETETANVLSAIETMSKMMTDRFDTLQESLATTQASLLSLGNRVKEIEEASSDYDRRLSTLEQTCTEMRAENTALRLKMTDLEARSRRQNIKIVGLPEKIENGRPTEFVTEFILELLGAGNFTKPLEVDRAHRVGRMPSGKDARPRVMIARIHHFQMREKILQLARQQFPLRHNSKAVHIFPDYPAEVMKERQAFNDARRKIRDAGGRSGFVYPAKLRVTHGDLDKVFSSPREAEALAETLI